MPPIAPADLPEAVQQFSFQVGIEGLGRREIDPVEGLGEFAFAASLGPIIMQDFMFQNSIGPGGEAGLKLNITVFFRDGGEGLLHYFLAILPAPYPLLHEAAKYVS